MPVKQTKNGFVATTSKGTKLGTFPSMASAQAAIKRAEKQGK